MFERFTERARKVMALANQEAQRFNHEYIGTEHILLALVKEGSGVGANVLKSLGVDLHKVRVEVEKLVKPGPDRVAMGKLPMTPAAKKVAEYAIEEARELNHNYIGTEHILLGLLREHDGVAAQVLMDLGLKLEEVRSDVLMTATLQQHITFWRELADATDRGEPLAAALEHAGKKIKGTVLEGVVKVLAKDVTAGQRLVESMKGQEQCFTPAVYNMAFAGELSGAMSVAARRIAEGLGEGSFTVPGLAPAQRNEQARYWGAMGLLLSSGIPIMQTLQLLGQEFAGGRLGEASEALQRGLNEGQSIVHILSQFPDTFAPEVVAAAGRGDGRDLDVAARQIAAALASGDLKGMATLQQHITFWRELANATDRGKTLIMALEQAGETLAGTELEGVAAAVAKDVRAGKLPSESMRGQQGYFTPMVCTMAMVGELSGAFQVAARRIAEGLEDGSFTVPGLVSAQGNEQAVYWGAMGLMLSSGVPVIETLKLLGKEFAGGRLGEASEALQRGIMEGQSVVGILSQFPDTFAPEVVAAAGRGEAGGDLDVVARRIAAALAFGNLKGLGPPAPTETPSPCLEIGGQSLAETGSSDPAQLVNRVLLEAVRNGASDIHFDPFEGELKIRMRVDGVLHEMQPPPKSMARAVVSRIKILARMDTIEHSIPQDGRFKMSANGKPVDLRVSTLPTIHGERVVMRLLRPNALNLDIAAFDFSEENLPKVRRFCGLPNGVVIVAGPTGCGKTTLLYSMLQEIDAKGSCVMTVEDPVEYSFANIAQVQTNPKVGLTFARVIRSMLRQDPDVIMAGEIRDLETAEILVQAAVTGHLVLTTLHTTNSPESIKRLLDMGLEPFLVGATVAGVISQRLIRLLCKQCRQKVQPSLESLPPAAAEMLAASPDATFYEPKGCDHCKGTGYHGRIGIHEVLVVDDAVRNAIAKGGELSAIRAAAVAGGMKTMLADGLEKAAAGVTSLREILSVAPGER